MNLILSNSSPVPLYEQLEQQLKTAIHSGELQPGQPLPSIRSLAASLATSIITVKRAYDDLEKEGYLFTTPGKGTFVSVDGVAALTESHLLQLKGELVELLRSFEDAGVTRSEVCRLIRDQEV
ncbi:MAG: GntR family transcriptional regulator [Clostridiales bacterium]